MCSSCAPATNEFWPHYSVHTGAYTNNKINKYERNNNSYNDNDVGGSGNGSGVGGGGIERRDQFKSGRPLSHSLVAPSMSSSTMATDAINLCDSVPNLCAGDNNQAPMSSHSNGHNQIKFNVKTGANKSLDAFSAGRASTQVFVDSIESAGATTGDYGRSRLLWAKPPISEKSSRIFFGVSLDEREMPITRERQTKALSAVAKRESNGRKANKLTAPGSVQSARNGNAKYDLCVDRPRNR